MTTLSETLHEGGFIVSEANNTRSREQVTVSQGQVLGAGAVLGRLTASGEYVAYDNAAADGSESAAAILYGPVDATAADVVATAIVRDAEVNLGELDFGANDQVGIDAGIVDLEALGIIGR